MLDLKRCALLVIDVQEKLFPQMWNAAALTRQVEILLQAVTTLELPLCCTEQYPQGLGPTLPGFTQLWPNPTTPIPKTAFSCCGESAFIAALQASRRDQLLVCGIESHICVYQTVRDLLGMDYEVQVLSDATGSRSEANHQLGLERCREQGATLSSVELALFELLGDARHPAFRKVAKLIK